MNSINFWPIIVASIVAFGISAFWYSPILFGKEWMNLTKASGKGTANNEMKGVWKLYIVQLVITVVLFTVVGFLSVTTGSRTASDGVFLALILWVGFSATSAIGEMLWQKTPLKLIMIVELCTLISWLVGGAIIGAWR